MCINLQGPPFSPPQASPRMVAPSARSTSLGFPCLTSAKILAWTSLRSLATWARLTHPCSSGVRSPFAACFQPSSTRRWRETSTSSATPLATGTCSPEAGCIRALILREGWQAASFRGRRPWGSSPWASVRGEEAPPVKIAAASDLTDPGGPDAPAQITPYTWPASAIPSLAWKKGPRSEPGRTMTNSCASGASRRAWARDPGGTYTASAQGLCQTWLCRMLLGSDGDPTSPSMIGVPPAPPPQSPTTRATSWENQFPSQPACDMSQAMSFCTNTALTASPNPPP